MSAKNARTAIAAWAMVVSIIFALSPSPTNPLCYNSPTYRNTHEQECLIDVVSPSGGGRGGGGGGSGSGLLGGLLHGLTGGLL